VVVRSWRREGVGREEEGVVGLRGSGGVSGMVVMAVAGLSWPC
jgi:hypothetical protein